jgi:hypothetical protein
MKLVCSVESFIVRGAFEVPFLDAIHHLEVRREANHHVPVAVLNLQVDNLEVTKYLVWHAENDSVTERGITNGQQVGIRPH